MKIVPSVNTLLLLARNEKGYLEKKSNANLDDKTKNAGYNNYTKYARDLDNIKDFYNGKKNGYAWCCVFVAWCFVKTFGVDRAKELLNYPSKSLGAGVKYAKGYFTKIKQYYDKPQKGDCIFFKNANGGMQHIGIVYDVDSKYVYTIEGNTSNSKEVVANGGGVYEKKYALTYKYIDGYGRPIWNDSEKEITNITMYISNVDYEGLNVRDKINGKVIGILPVGTKVNVIEKGTWCKINEGYVYGEYLSTKQPKVKIVNAKDGLNIRKTYSTKGKKIGVLKYGTPVQVFKTHLGWSKISPTENAWVSSNYLK